MKLYYSLLNRLKLKQRSLWMFLERFKMTVEIFFMKGYIQGINLIERVWGILLQHYIQDLKIVIFPTGFESEASHL